jgi:hypothetical protein
MTRHQRKPMHREGDIRAVVRRRLGLITTTQALQWISESTISRRVKAGAWERVLEDLAHPAGKRTHARTSTPL